MLSEVGQAGSFVDGVADDGVLEAAFGFDVGGDDGAGGDADADVDLVMVEGGDPVAEYPVGGGRGLWVLAGAPKTQSALAVETVDDTTVAVDDVDR